MSDVEQTLIRFWQDLINRPSGPMTIRFILQPVTAGFLAIRDGIKDARTGRPPYFWMVLTDSSRRMAALREGMTSVMRVLILGMVMDTIYQFIVFHTFHLLEAVVLTFCIAFLPYLLTRGPAERIARRWLHRDPAKSE